ncbi:LysR substrate-binding domain-containing protein, partial [Mesorhizobium sp. M8A.F.Ca.ET.167.01.1.1]|uniref:LysR substrate-binding domain-containing protein n=1 Tax=Mesorhizobium sp. M8A.F.Ca.ET.167.01.1.1 TaxID=2563961 RepID=UPI001FE09F22
MHLGRHRIGVDDVFAAEEAFAAATQRMTRPASAGVLSVSCVSALLLLWMTPRLGSFTAQYPDIQLTLIPSNDARHIRAPHIDVFVHYGDGGWTACWIRKWSRLD